MRKEFDLKPIFRWVLCWYGRAIVTRLVAGSIPAAGAVAVLYWFRNLAVNEVYVGSMPIGHPVNMEGIRPDEDAVLKTVGAKHASGFESLAFRFRRNKTVLWSSGEGTWFTTSRSTVRVRPGLL